MSDVGLRHSPRLGAPPWGARLYRGRPWLTWEEGNGRPPAASEQHAAARFWAAHGLPVCRLIPQDKRPTDKAPRTTGRGSEHRLATTDLDTIDRWWGERHPRWGPRAGCNPGLPTGRWPGFLALDVDRPQAFEAWVSGRPLPPTLRWSSCRPDRPERYTLLYRYPAVSFVVRSVVDGRPGCVPGADLRAEGEHVVLPGARHPRGTVYAIQRNVLAARPPPWLVDELARRTRSAPRRVGPPGQSQGRGCVGGAVLDEASALHEDLHPEAYRRALHLFRRAAERASVAHGQRHRVLVGLAWEGLARGLLLGDVRRVVLAYVRGACPERGDLAEGVRQLEEALATPSRGAAEPNEPRFSVAGQVRWLSRTKD